jgi:hypothetical protein
MKLFEIYRNPLQELLSEEAVISSWISDLDYDDDTEGVWMRTLGGGEYLIPNVPREEFEAWLEADSKGRYWHSDIRDIYT